jgi:hypothetical protein
MASAVATKGRGVMSIFVTVAGPRRSIDLELTEEAPVGELIPLLVELHGIGTGNRNLDGAQVWGVGPWGGNPIPPAISLEKAQIADGAILVLQDLASWHKRHHQQAARPVPVPANAQTGGIGIKWNTDSFMQDD